MASSNPQIVGGGIQAGGIYTLGHLIYATNVSPPQAMTYGPEVVVDSVSAVQYTAIPDSTGLLVVVTGANESLRVKGGMIVEGAGTGTVQIGEGALATAADGIAIGRGAISDITQTIVIGATATNSVGGGQQGVIVGHAASMNNAAGVVIGHSAAIAGNGGGATCVAIGNSASATAGTAGGGTSVAIGNNAVAVDTCVVIGGGATSNINSASGVGSVVIGHLASSNKAAGFTVVIGWSSSCTQIGGVVIGSASSATAAAAQNFSIVIGSGSALTSDESIIIGGGGVDYGPNIIQLGAPFTKINTMLFGAGAAIASPAAKLWWFTSAVGTDNAAGAFTLIAPLSTGAGTPAPIIFQVGAVAASSGTVQTPTTVMTIGDQIVTFAGLISAAGLPTSAGAAGTLWVNAGVVQRA